MAERIIVNKHFDSGTSVSLSSFAENEILRKGEMVIVNDASAPALYIVDTNNNVVNVAAQGEIDPTKVKVSGVTLDKYISLAVAAAASKVTTIPHFLTETEYNELITSGFVTTQEEELVVYSDKGLYYIYESSTPSSGSSADYVASSNTLVIKKGTVTDGVLELSNATLDGNVLVFSQSSGGGNITYDDSTKEITVSGDGTELDGEILTLPSSMVTLENNILIYSN